MIKASIEAVRLSISDLRKKCMSVYLCVCVCDQGINRGSSSVYLRFEKEMHVCVSVCVCV